MMHRSRKSWINHFVSIICLLCNATVHVVVVEVSLAASRDPPKRAALTSRTHTHGCVVVVVVVVVIIIIIYTVITLSTSRLSSRVPAVYMFACRRNSSARCWYPTCVLSPNCAHVMRPLPLASRRRFAASSLSISAVSPFTPGLMRATRDMPTAFHARAICKPQNPQLEVVFLAARAVRIAGVARRGEFRHCSWCIACGVLGRWCARRRAAMNEDFDARALW